MAPETNELQNEMYRFMSEQHVVTIAYSDSAGVGACAVWYAVEPGLTLYFASSHNTRHGRALEQGGQVAFTIQKDEQDWHTIQGIQGTGYCQALAPGQWESAWETYSARFPFVLKPFGSIALAISTVALWSIQPQWLRMVDNTKGFSHKDELTIKERVSQR